MKTSTKRFAKHVAVAGGVLVAIGLNVGWWTYDKAAFFLPKVTARRLVELERQAKRAARRERAA